MTFVSLFNVCIRILYAIRDFALQFINILTEPFIDGYSLLDGIFVFFITTLVVRLLLTMAPG